MGVEPCLPRSPPILLTAVGRQRHEEHPAPERGPEAPADFVAVDAQERADFILLMALSPIFESRWREFLGQPLLLTSPTHARLSFGMSPSREQRSWSVPERSTMTSLSPWPLAS
jgi:hypothetical protein